MKYTREFKEEALKLSDEVGVRHAAAQLGLPYYTLADWRNKRKQEQHKVPDIYTRIAYLPVFGYTLIVLSCTCFLSGFSSAL